MARQRPPLLPCRTLWGTCERRDARPGWRRFTQADFHPIDGDAPWGLFARNGSLLGTGRAPSTPLAEPEPGETGPTLYIGLLALHYGHFLINTLPHLWPLVGWQGERPKLLCHAKPGSWHGAPFLEKILGRLGYGLDDLVTFERPVRLSDVLVPEPALHEQASVHAIYGDLCRAIGEGFWTPGEVDSVARPAYLAKTRLASGITRLVNEVEIADELARNGVEIVHPETLDLPAQVRLLSQRRTILGTVGSAFHTTVFAAPNRRLVGLNWQPALNANFALLDGLNGTRARYLHAPGTLYRERGAFEVSWEVPDPRGIARAMLAEAEALDRGLGSRS
ncbi:glycosyltransferase family 61 protein [Methylorubrum sp. SB2]|uniref:glycosyltransferase family 61 protein n=1 Tax=Methylorubrum subtropicum TaxID=3138812 RepID=UPI00313C857A